MPPYIRFIQTACLSFIFVVLLPDRKVVCDLPVLTGGLGQLAQLLPAAALGSFGFPKKKLLSIIVKIYISIIVNYTLAYL